MKGFYAIIDPEFCKHFEPKVVAQQILEGGCCALQLRFKEENDQEFLNLARAIRMKCKKANVPFFVNDRADIAMLSKADGVHVGQSDMPVAAIRRTFPSLKIGLSTHNLSQLEQAMFSGVDYAGFGPVFSTQSKEKAEPAVGLSLLEQAIEKSKIPLVAIGGINLGSIQSIGDTGVSMVAAISAVCGSENPSKVASQFHQTFLKFSH